MWPAGNSRVTYITTYNRGKLTWRTKHAGSLCWGRVFGRGIQAEAVLCLGRSDSVRLRSIMKVTCYGKSPYNIRLFPRGDILWLLFGSIIRSDNQLPLRWTMVVHVSLKSAMIPAGLLWGRSYIVLPRRSYLDRLSPGDPWRDNKRSFDYTLARGEWIFPHDIERLYCIV